MATSPMGDILGARYHWGGNPTNASVASNGANASLAALGPFAVPVRVRSAWWTPTGAGQTSSISGSYRQLILLNGGTAGTVTATGNIMASLNVSASATGVNASMLPIAWSVLTGVTAASGSLLVYSQQTVGGTDANGTVLQAGVASFAFEVI